MKKRIFVLISFYSALSFAGQVDELPSGGSYMMTAPNETLPSSPTLFSCERSESCASNPTTPRTYLKSQVCVRETSAVIVEGTEWSLGCPNDVVSEGKSAKLEYFSKTLCEYRTTDNTRIVRCYYTHTDGRDIR